MSKTNSSSMFIIGMLFFIFGFVTWLNGSLIPFLKELLSLDNFEALFVTFAFYIAYTVMALPVSFLLERSGYKNGMAIGLIIMAIGSLLFIPAALYTSFLLFLVALFMLGTGLTMLQTASNPYIVLIGPIESAATRISIMGLINKIAGVIVPLVFSSIILSDLNSMSSTETLANKLVIPYFIMSIVLILLVVLIKFSSLPELKFEKIKKDEKSVFSFPRVILGSIALFFYVGIEVIAGDTIGLYAQTIGVRDVTSLTSYTMGFMVVGYIVGILVIPKYISQKNALIGSSLLGSLFIIGIVFSTDDSYFISNYIWGWSFIPPLPDTITFVALLGLSNALVWPTIWPLALEGLGKNTPKASAILIMAISGGALLPLLFGKISQYNLGMQNSYLIGLVCYFFIFMFGFKWHKMESWKIFKNG